MGVTVYSIVASVIFFNIALVTAFIMRRSSTFVARRTVSYLLLMVLLGIIRLLTPIDFDKAFVVRSYQVIPMIEDFLNRPIVGSYTFGSLLLLVWLAGTVTFIVRDMIIQIRFIHASRNYPPSDRRDLLDLAGEYGSNFGLLVSSSISRPYTAGLFRPVIYLPDIELPEEQWRTILRHEVQHIRSHDEVKKLFFLAIQALFWWNPLAHISRKEIDTILELQCDAKVTAGMSNEEVDAYLDLLWTLKERKAEQRIPVGASTMVWDQKQLEARFEALQDASIAKKRRPRIVAHSLLIALFILSYSVIVQPAGFPDKPRYWDDFYSSDEIYILPYSTEASHEYIVYKNNEYYFYVDGNFICRIDEEALSEEPFNSMPIMEENK